MLLSALYIGLMHVQAAQNTEASGTETKLSEVPAQQPASHVPQHKASATTKEDEQVRWS